MKTCHRTRTRAAAFSLVEVMISVTIVGLCMGLCLTTFLIGAKMMYKDTIRLQTNASLRFFTAQMSKETVDASEFYLFSDYTKLDGSVDIDPSDGSSDLAVPVDDGNGTMLASGDCVVLVTRTSLESGAKVRQLRIYYRVATSANVNNAAPIRYYESIDYGTTGTTTTLNAMLNALNLNSTPAIAGSRQITATAKGRRVGTTTNYYPIFCSEGPIVTATNESFSINVEFIAGNATINMLSSSSFNYTVSPRR
jgi:hypothetical protein